MSEQLGTSDCAVDKVVVDGVQEVVSRVLNTERDHVQLSKRVGDFPNWDSLASISMIVELSDRFSVEVDALVIVECETIVEICEYMTSLLSKGPEGHPSESHRHAQ